MRKIRVTCILCDKGIRGFRNESDDGKIRGSANKTQDPFAENVFFKHDGRKGYVHLKCLKNFNPTKIDWSKVEPENLEGEDLNRLVIRALDGTMPLRRHVNFISDPKAFRVLQEIIHKEMSYEIHYHKDGSVTVTTRDEFPYGRDDKSEGAALCRFFLKLMRTAPKIGYRSWNMSD